MQKTLIIYKSETGFTQKYAKWLSNELSCDICDLKDCSKDKINNYDILIYGGGIYAGQINGFKDFKNMVPSDKKLILFMTGATPLDESDTIQKAFDTNLTADEQDKIPHFYAASGLIYEKMSFKHKMMMKGLILMLKNKQPEFCEMISKSFDNSDFSYLNGLVECVRDM